MDTVKLAAMIDHTVLKPDARAEEVERFCQEARTHGFRSVCVNGTHAAAVAAALAGSDVRVCVVVGFPLGAMTAAAKAAETEDAVRNGAAEIDMVLNIGALKDGDLDRVRADIAAVRAACSGRVLKVIIETCLLDDEQKRAACRISAEEGADFVKTSTGFSTSGATVEDVALMREVVGPDLGVKASGGVRTRDAALRMIAAGANRIGTSSGIAIVSGGEATGAY
ncbi:deoxyribose-phosphate aldolase [Acetobacteraceae bacterium KSS8]|uniref:Deoxyribose-phosphate aldolase n=1 Tax=Endosaccharibacter trunci TaxID=2812733 RepID=A0ABT1W4J2_9PROT|nr:deoxyribose-phosphate aldolase [Acetobacteraceae bacterium KSS8]